MATAALTRKRHITLPEVVRTALGLRAGAKVDFVGEGDGFKLVPLKSNVSTLKGRVAGRTAKPVSIKAMNDAVGDAAAVGAAAVRTR